MCLAIVKPKGLIIPDNALRAGWIGNSDGGGYAFVKDGKVEIRNAIMKLKDFLERYRQDEAENPESAFLVHFRICSMGAKSADNTHPFPIEGGALIHNGTLTGTAAKYGMGPSDTKLFADRYAKDLSYDFVLKHKDAWNSALTGNKLGLLYDDGRYQIVNEDSGVWSEGIWYSNHSFKPYGRIASMIETDEWEEWDDYGWGYRH